MRGKANDLVGNRYGRLIVISVSDKRTKWNRYWNCICDCGTEKAIAGRNLLNGDVRSCGCFQREGMSIRAKKSGSDNHRYGKKYPKYADRSLPAFNWLYLNYKKNAENRGLAFEITKENFSQLTKQKCNYCKSDPYAIAKAKGSEYTYNGIDRIDSDRGYVEGNMVTCCKICNRAKMDLSLNEFLNWINRLRNN